MLEQPLLQPAVSLAGNLLLLAERETRRNIYHIHGGGGLYDGTRHDSRGAVAF